MDAAIGADATVGADIITETLRFWPGHAPDVLALFVGFACGCVSLLVEACGRGLTLSSLSSGH